MLIVAFAAASCATQTLFGAEDAAATIDSPVGGWSCLLYAERGADNDYVLMRFDPAGTTQFARPRGNEFRLWAPVSAWTARKKRLTFSDSREGREFEAELERSGLGGVWETASSKGGWWCARLSDDVASRQDLEGLTVDDVMPPLIPYAATTPYYPLYAVRTAQEGHASVCFLVESTGAVVKPEFIELSDDIFRATTLRAIQASTYRGWRGEPAVRPACRTFDFALDPSD